jgi:hypothetical protein
MKMTTFAKMFAPTLKSWSVKAAGPKVTEAELATAASLLKRHGTAKHMGLAMYLRAGGATQVQVFHATGDTQVNVARDMINDGKAKALPMPAAATGHKVYRLALATPAAPKAKRTRKPAGKPADAPVTDAS